MTSVKYYTGASIPCHHADAAAADDDLRLLVIEFEWVIVMRRR